MKKEFTVDVFLNDLAPQYLRPNQTVEILIDNTKIVANYYPPKSNKVSQLFAKVTVAFSNMLNTSQTYDLTVRVMDNPFLGTPMVISSKAIKVLVMEDGSVSEVVENQKPQSNDSCDDKFKKVAPIILQHEGGYVNNANDSGGPTNKGITLITFKEYAKEDLNIEPTLDNLKKITDEQATIIYKKRYWQPKGFCDINDLKIALMIYDWTITSGGAVKQVQKLLVNEYKKDISIDGIFGTQTINSINSIENQDELLLEISKIRKDYYTDLAYDKDGNKTKNYEFLKGWINRVDDCLNIKL